MPRKTKEQIEKENKEKEPIKSTSTTKKASATTKKTATTKSTKAKTSSSKTAKKSTTKKATTSIKTTTAKKSTTKKASSTKKSVATKKATTKKSTAAKSLTAKKTATKKTTTRKRTTSSKKKVEIVEYYDLPYRYNQTIVKVLAQTPTTLFIYWDIADKDRKAFEDQYGEKFFEQTKPVLIVRNTTLNYSFEVEINDFANSWYLHVADSKCDYQIELGRRPIVKTEKINVDYIYLTTSNEIESPNDKILFNPNQKMVYFKDVKTGIQTEKSVQSISFIRNMGKIYNIYDLYKEIYQNEDIDGIYDVSNPSSGSNHII